MANHNLGTAYRELGDLQTAREYFKKVLEIDPADANAMAALGRVELLAGAERLSNELARHPSAEGYQQLGELLEQAGKLELAEDAYEKERALRSRGKP
jgi:tetratricopeptide (TPR) repeat protein